MADKNSKPINQVDIEKILKENNAFLKKVGGQIEQAEFKRDVKRALEILSNNYEKKSNDKNYNVLDDYDAVVRLMKEVDVSEDSDCFKSLISNFMPEEYEKVVEEKKNNQKEEKEVTAEEVEKDETNEVTEQVESGEKTETEAEIEQEVPEVEEQETEETTTQDEEKEEEISNETEGEQEEVAQEAKPESEGTKQDQDEQEQETESKKQKETEQDSEKDDQNKKNEKKISIGNAINVIREIKSTAKALHKARRNDRGLDKKYIDGIKDIKERAEKTIISGKILGMNGGDLHDFFATLAVGIKALAEMTIYSAGKVTLKLARGAKQFIGKKFTATKGTAQKAKERADAKRARINEQKEKNKKEKEDEALNVIGDSATSIYEFKEITEKRAKEIREVCDENCKEDFLDNLEKSADFRAKIEEKLETKNSYDIKNRDTLIYDIKEQYKKIIYDNMYREIKNNFKGLSDEKIKRFINASGIKKGQLSLSSNGYITEEQLKDSELYETLEKTNKIEKYLNNLSEEDIDSLLKLSHKLNSKIETPKGGPVSNKSSLVFGLNEVNHDKSNKELGINESTYEFAKMLTELNIPYEMANKEVENVNKSVKYIDANSDVLKYCYALDLQSLATELWFQMVDMRTELNTMTYKQDGKTISDELRKKELMSIATSKVKALEKKGILETIQEENGKEIKILSEAEDILVDVKDIEKIVNNKKSRIYRGTKNTENDEQTVEDSQEQEP